MLVLAGSFSSCAEKEESGGDVPYKPCPCEEEKSILESKPFQGEAYLFKNSIPEKMVNLINTEMYSYPFPKVCWIVYFSNIDSVVISIGNLLYPNGGSIVTVGTICNFPDFAKEEWIIPENGCKIDIEGVMYSACNIPYPSPSPPPPPGGSEEEWAEVLAVYPNPASSQLSIEIMEDSELSASGAAPSYTVKIVDVYAIQSKP